MFAFPASSAFDIAPSPFDFQAHPPMSQYRRDRQQQSVNKPRQFAAFRDPFQYVEDESENDSDDSDFLAQQYAAAAELQLRRRRLAEQQAQLEWQEAALQEQSRRRQLQQQKRRREERARKQRLAEQALRLREAEERRRAELFRQQQQQQQQRELLRHAVEQERMHRAILAQRQQAALQKQQEQREEGIGASRPRFHQLFRSDAQQTNHYPQQQQKPLESRTKHAATAAQRPVFAPPLKCLEEQCHERETSEDDSDDELSPLFADVEPIFNAAPYIPSPDAAASSTTSEIPAEAEAVKRSTSVLPERPVPTDVSVRLVAEPKDVFKSIIKFPGVPFVRGLERL